MAQITELQVIDLSVQIGGLKAVSNVSLELKAGELVGLIGPNGAGKTTLFNAITGFSSASGGKVLFQAQDLTNKLPHTIAKYRLARTFQNIRLFKNLSIMDNLKIVYHGNFQYSLLSSIFRTPNFRRQEKAAVDFVLHVLALVGLEAKVQEKAGSLSYGEQRKLEIARALAMEPRLLL